MLTEACCSHARHHSAAGLSLRRWVLRFAVPRPTAASAHGSPAQALQSAPAASGVIARPRRGCARFACVASHPDPAAAVAPDALIAQNSTGLPSLLILRVLASLVRHAFENLSSASEPSHHRSLQTRTGGTALASSGAAVRVAMTVLNRPHPRPPALVRSQVDPSLAARLQARCCAPLDRGTRLNARLLRRQPRRVRKIRVPGGACVWTHLEASSSAVPTGYLCHRHAHRHPRP